MSRSHVKTHAIFCGFARLTGCTLSETPSAAPRDVPTYTIEDFMNNKEIFGSSVSPDLSNVFPDEGHGFVKKANETRGYQAVLDFLDKYLKGPGTAPVALR